ncbi:MAG: DUF262 domain-containing protein [Chloroflexi bacterium]|nr:DUF262 domain-containing protein [Chloroflexota bacterium]
MKVSEILNHVDHGFIALPVFQRGYVWNRDQVRQLFTSMYRSYPVGSLLLWGTQSNSVEVRGDLVPAVSPVQMLLDGQQRVTSLYGVIRGTPPPFFDGNRRAFEDLYFHLEDETFAFSQPMRMKGDVRWVDVSKVMQAGDDELPQFASNAAGEDMDLLLRYLGRLGKLRNIRERHFHEEAISVEDQSLDVIVDIFNRVNSGGTKLSSGDLALSRVCAEWPEARDAMKSHLQRWADLGYDKFDLVWLLRSVNTVLTGRANFDALRSRSAEEIQDGLRRAVDAIERLLNLLGDRLGLDHARVLTGHNSLAVMARYVDQQAGKLTLKEENQLLYWYLACAIRSRFSGSPESTMQSDLTAMESPDGDLDRLIEELHLSSGEIKVEAGHFDAARINSRFFPLLYALTRTGSARDFCSGLELKKHMLGKGSHLQLHHLFPKSQLRGHYPEKLINALANFSFLTAECNGAKNIGNQLPQVYFPECESNHPGVLASQWIPGSDDAWIVNRYEEFLDQRRDLLADAANGILKQLREGSMPLTHLESAGGVTAAEDEEAVLLELVAWVTQHGLSAGELGHELAPEEDGQAVRVLDLAWPEGLQPELSEPVAVLLDEPSELMAEASSAGFRCFTDADSFRRYVLTLIGESEEAA